MRDTADRHTPGRTYGSMIAAEVAASVDVSRVGRRQMWEPPGPATLGMFVRCRRLRLGLTFRDAASAAGVAVSTFCKVEFDQCEAPPRVDTLTKMAKALQVPPAELLAWSHLRRTPEAVRALLVSLLTGADIAEDLTEPAEAIRRLLTTEVNHG